MLCYYQYSHVHLRVSSPLTLTLETSTGFRTSTENGEPVISLSMYTTFTLCVPISVGLYVVSKAVAVTEIGSSWVLPFGLVANTLQVGSGPNLPSFFVGAMT